MYESEANWLTGSAEEIPPEGLARFAEARAAITARSLIPWGEHCTECAWPGCYSTCDLYVPREDGRCRRFTEGMVRIPFPRGINPYLLKITFKRWAKLWATARADVQPIALADRREKNDLRIAAWLHRISVPWARLRLIRKRYSWKRKSAWRTVPGAEAANCIMVECYNPSFQPIDMTLSIRAKGSLIPFLARLSMQPGFNLHRIGIGEVRKSVDLSLPLDLDLAPNEIRETCTLYFGAIDFVRDNSYEDPASLKPEKPRLCKCVVWDLDNTLWAGILVEDGPQRLTLRPQIPEILRQLDERGILISAASKNHCEEALSILHGFHLEHYFLFPQIDWSPKSDGIKTIANHLNIGLDTILFIDDSEFEREQVRSQCPEVAVLDAADYLSILDRPDTQVPVTEESRKRRLFYREQETREGARKTYAGEYVEFLRSCKLHLVLRRLCEANMQRVHELTQRTNQMNFSGNLYTREQLREIGANPQMETYVMDCEDRFGNYGTVGFAVIQAAEPRMTDLMFSCRVQGKHVEHAFLYYLLRKYRSARSRPFYADYRKTTRNAASGQVFDDLGFVTLCQESEISRLCYPESREPEDEAIVLVIDESPVSRTEVVA